MFFLGESVSLSNKDPFVRVDFVSQLQFYCDRATSSHLIPGCSIPFAYSGACLSECSVI